MSSASWGVTPARRRSSPKDPAPAVSRGRARRNKEGEAAAAAELAEERKRLEGSAARLEMSSGAILRRNSSRQGLQDLLRLTTQWSIEDEEEAARERRRREREKQLQSQSEGDATDTGLPGETGIPAAQDNQFDFKPSGPLEMEEDEGFSDWSLKLEQRKQKWVAEGSPEAESACTREWSGAQDGVTTYRDRKDESENMEVEDKEEDYHVNEEEEEEMARKEGGSRVLREETLEIKDTKEHEDWNYRGEKPKQRDQENETEGSYTSSTWAQQEMMQEDRNEDAFQKEVTSEYQVQSKRILRSPRRSHEEEDQELDDGMQEAEAKLEKIRLRQEQKESMEFERTRQEQLEVDAELEEQRRLREEEEWRQEHEKQKHLARQEITDLTESLNRSIKKSNSIKKSEPALPISRIDERLEQYTHAVESSSKTTKLVRQPSIELPSAAEAVASKKNLFETGEAAAQSSAKTTPCKDTEGLNIGVSDLINQWAKGPSEEGAKQTPSKPTDLTAGDILSKRSLWEHKDSAQSANKGAAAGKKYKFVLTGHGKYEKVYVEDSNY
ncbi:lymphocyte-specific protein 1 isoform X3 [Rhinatrema bivittatum]|uniref:lymphocyte-specific protein 1 isoform X3 n=1 Tax=Rhinatrema bivittatum TaxID=194408 RepID=UPI00112B388B|nr:lymphocyte-specific protein 1 isoform X3 [Rhinatrema bivittatum]